MNVAYLINQYPKVSHSFIRREIEALEKLGLTIHRFAIRACEAELVDAKDFAELEKTSLVLDQGIAVLLLAFLKVLVRQPLKMLGVLVYALKLSFHSDTGAIKHFAYLCEASSLLNDFQQLGITHVHTHFGTNSTTVALLCYRLGGPGFSFTVHGPEEFDRVHNISLPEKVDQARFVFAVSSFTKSQLFRWCPHTQWSKIKLIRCGLDDTFLQTPVAPLTTQPQLVCVGRLCEQKGQLLLVKAAKILADVGYQFKLVLVGDGEMRPLIESLIQSYNLRDSITITGWADSEAVKQYIQASRVFVLPSLAEGLPVALMEAMALERPVISTYIAGIPELVVPNENGWLIPPGSVSYLVSALKAALDTPTETLQELGQRGAERVRAQHDCAKIAQQISLLFETTNTPQPTTHPEMAMALPEYRTKKARADLDNPTNLSEGNGVESNMELLLTKARVQNPGTIKG